MVAKTNQFQTSSADDSAASEYNGLGHSLKNYRWSALARWRLFLLFLVGLILIPLQALVLKIMPRTWWPIPGLWHRAICRIIGLKVQIIGQPSQSGPILFVANHISWLDIFLMGGHMPKASFVAKSDIAGWGLAHFLASLQRTVYVRRHRRTDSARQRDDMLARLKDGDNLIMFPEGTSTEGTHMLSFKSALFSVAEKADEETNHRLFVQPVTISYPEVNGIPMVRALRPLVAWLGNEEIISHIRHFLASGRTAATIEFHEPVHLNDVGDRKALAGYCESKIRAGLERAHRLEYKMGDQIRGDASGKG